MKGRLGIIKNKVIVMLLSLSEIWFGGLEFKLAMIFDLLKRRVLYNFIQTKYFHIYFSGKDYSYLFSEIYLNMAKFNV